MAYKFTLGIQVKKLIAPAILLAAMASCSGAKNDNGGVTQIRIVDLNGNPKPVKSYVPEMNAKILAARGMKIDEKTGGISPINSASSGKAAAIAPSATPVPAPGAVNQAQIMAQNSMIPASDQSASFASESLPEVTARPVAAAPALAPKPTAVRNKSYALVSPKSSSVSSKKIQKNNEEESVEYNLADNYAASEGSKTKKFKMMPGKEAVKTSASTGEIFIQIGSYPSSEMANDYLTKTAAISAGKVEEAEVKGKKFYRVILGPIDNKQKAHHVLRKLANSGYKDAFIVK